jgi:hypothetical protein
MENFLDIVNLALQRKKDESRERKGAKEKENKIGMISTDHRNSFIDSLVNFFYIIYLFIYLTTDLLPYLVRVLC